MKGLIERNGHYSVRKVYRDSQGRKKQIWRKATDLKDAQRVMREIENELANGTESFENRDTLGEFLDKWLKTSKQKVSGRTYEDYVGLMRLYVRPVLGSKKLASLRPLDIQELVNGMVDRKLSPRTVRYTHAILCRALRRAVRWKILSSNPAEGVELPKSVRRELNVLTPVQAQAFLKQAYKGKHGLMFDLAINTGMRPEEYLGLKWGDIDFEAKTVTVQRTLVWKRWKTEWYFGEPKTSRSRRSIPLSDTLVRGLKTHQTRQKEARLARGEAWADLGLVFCSWGKNKKQNYTGAGNPHSIRNLQRRHFKPILDKAKLPDIRLYDLRHTCATLLLLAGENVKVVSERLGHASVAITLDTYAAVLPSMQQGATDKLEKMLKR